MNPLAGVLSLTFDCYGTLIDWKKGLADAFQRIFDPSVVEDMDRLFDGYVRAEADAEAGEYQSYRNVLAQTTREVAKMLGRVIAPQQEHRLAECLGEWLPFPDTNDSLRRLQGRFKLGVLSNVDRDLFALTQRKLTAPFDFVITAQDVRAYKPAPAHFAEALRRDVKADTNLHVGQSPFHDGVALRDHAIRFVWINRYQERNTTDVSPTAEFGTLTEFADAVLAANPAVSARPEPLL